MKLHPPQAVIILMKSAGHVLISGINVCDVRKGQLYLDTKPLLTIG